MQIVYTISFIVIAPASVQSAHWHFSFFCQCHIHLLICALISSRWSNNPIKPPQVLVGNLLSTPCSSRLCPVVDRLSNLFQGFLGSSFAHLNSTNRNLNNQSLININHMQQIDYGVVIEQMTHQTVLEKYQVQSHFY